MTDFLLLLILTALWCFGFRAVFQEDMILQSVGDRLWGFHDEATGRVLKKGLLPMWLCKPLFQCPACMSSIYGTYAYFAFFNHQPLSISDTISLWVAFVFCLCGLNYLLTKLILE